MIKKNLPNKNKYIDTAELKEYSVCSKIEHTEYTSDELHCHNLEGVGDETEYRQIQLESYQYDFYKLIMKKGE